MKSTRVDANGTVRCPKCGATSFNEKRTGKAKWMAVPTVGVGVLAMPKRLKCNGCGTNLKRSGGGSSPLGDAADKGLGMAFEAVESWEGSAKAKLEQHKAAIEQAKAGAVGDPLPEGVHPKSVRARQIRKAREQAAMKTEGDAPAT